MNKPEYTAYPHENEFLLPEGANVLINSVTEEYSNKYNRNFTVVKMSLLNDWGWDVEQSIVKKAPTPAPSVLDDLQ